MKGIYETELDYMSCFCDVKPLEHCIRFEDSLIEDMYSHNVSYIRFGSSVEEMLRAITEEIDYRKRIGKRFLRVVTHTSFDDSVFDGYPLKPDMEKFDYYGISTDRYETVRQRDNALVRLADKKEVSEDGRIVDIIANYQGMTLEFAVRRIDRKFQVYHDDSKKVNLYVCYDGIEPVGNCELLIGEGIAKIEDFDIIEMHQRKGFGSHMLHELLRISREKGAKQAYLITDHDDTAKEMYVKTGFELIGQRSEMMFHLT